MLSPEKEDLGSSDGRLAMLLVERLDEPDRSIILLKANGLSWKMVCVELSKRGLLGDDNPINPTTIERIKKKGQRTSKRLRNLIEEAGKLHKRK